MSWIRAIPNLPAFAKRHVRALSKTVMDPWIRLLLKEEMHDDVGRELGRRQRWWCDWITEYDRKNQKG